MRLHVYTQHSEAASELHYFSHDKLIHSAKYMYTCAHVMHAVYTLCTMYALFISILAVLYGDMMYIHV